MKLSTILGSVLVSSLIFASTALAQNRSTHNAAGTCRGRTAALNACFDGNNEGWLWFNWSSSGACNTSTAALVCGIEGDACTTNGRMVTVDGNCSTSMNCYVRVVNYTDGMKLPAYPMTITGGPGNFHSSAAVPCADIGTRNYVTVQCDVPIGCKIWGISTQDF